MKEKPLRGTEHQDGWAPLKKGYQPAKEGTGGTNPPPGGTGGNQPSPSVPAPQPPAEKK